MEFRDLNIQYKRLKDKIDKEISEVLSTSTYISGPKVAKLEKELARYVGVKNCISCGNGTDAISLALMAWGVGKGDAVFVPDFTFFSSGECVALQGATPVFVDINQRTFNIDPLKLEKAIIKTKKEQLYTPKAVVAVDLFGLPADYSQIRLICKKYGLLLLEDGAQGFGGSINGKKACSFGDISTTSFFPAKPLGCYGDGGAIFTDNDEWAKIIRSLAVHGKANDDKYNNIQIGMNSRLDAIQAAVLSVKLEAFREYELEEVNKVARYYSEKLRDSSLICPMIPKGFYSSWAQYTVQLPQTTNRDHLQTKLRSKGIPTMVYYMKPMHLQSAFNTYESIDDLDCQITKKICKTVLSLPIHPYLTMGEVDYITKSLLTELGK